MPTARPITLSPLAAAATAFPLWKQWNIDLVTVGAGLKSVKSLTVGLGDGKPGGKGMVCIDDLRLYRAAPPIVAPVDPGSGSIVANYKMDGNVQDSSGKNNHGKESGDALYDNGVVGKALAFNGTNTYVDLPLGSVVSSCKDITITIYVNVTGTAAWARILDFGKAGVDQADPNVYMYLTADNGYTRTPQFVITTDGVPGESVVRAPSALAPGWHHLAVVIDSASMTMRLYVDGWLADSGPTTDLPADLGVTTQNWLGDSLYTVDPYFTGLLDEFRIYNRALSDGEIRYLAGDR